MVPNADIQGGTPPHLRGPLSRPRKKHEERRGRPEGRRMRKRGELPQCAADLLNPFKVSGTKMGEERCESLHNE
jgi:hypothetical protein